MEQVKLKVLEEEKVDVRLLVKLKWQVMAMLTVSEKRRQSGQIEGNPVVAVPLNP